MQGILHLSRFGGSDFTVSFGPLGPPGTGGPIPVRGVATLEAVETLLKELSINSGKARTSLHELKEEGSAFIGVVDIPEPALRAERLV